MLLKNGIKLLEEIEGSGSAARKGDRVVYSIKILLNQGDEVRLDEAIGKDLPGLMIEENDGRICIVHSLILGKRQSIAGVENSLMGMKAGGFRKVRVSPHLAYRDQGIPGLIPENAVVVIEIWLRSVATDS